MTTSTTLPSGVVFTQPQPATIRLDLGCGNNKKEGHIGVDRDPQFNPDVLLDFGKERLPWDDGTVDEVWSSHSFEHLWPWERVHLANELYRVMKPGARATVIVPHYAGARALGDFSHAWVAVYDQWPVYTNKAWRDVHAPHLNVPTTLPFLGLDGRPIVVPAYACDFNWTGGYSPSPSLAGRNQEYVQFAVANYRDAVMDYMFTLIRP